MRLINEKGETSHQRGNQKERGNRTHRRRSIRIRLSSCDSQRQPLTFCRDDRTGGYSCSTAIGTITGGILEQLILEVKEDIANSEARVDRLRDRMELLTSLKASLEK
ncbi:hypothetical protein VB638_19820 [Dolichospermum sp. UHCC 0684]|uniref:hypothetical protein n=1 Tax=Dolichospermum sp. UHCC 0684 TaxID=3110242 RepID=UPI002B1F2902|nr:hypothetical protein [Dolichospermum sp. UHCC 0684]MEA5531789.1 hypothetical protein [Dolichospermum sp. UHCC 0684]